MWDSEQLFSLHTFPFISDYFPTKVWIASKIRLLYFIFWSDKKALKTYPQNKDVELLEMSDLQSAYRKVCFGFFCAFKSQMGVKWPKSSGGGLKATQREKVQILLQCYCLLPFRDCFEGARGFNFSVLGKPHSMFSE